MGWQDRDYAKPAYGHGPVYRTGGPGGWGPFGATGGRGIVNTLIIINAVVFVACTLTSERGFVLSSPIFQFGAMNTPLILHGQVWRLLTSHYLHWSFGHILMNMIGLYFLGRPLERIWGARKFFGVYTLSGLLGSLIYVLLSSVDWLPLDGIAAGASGCVLGLLGVCAVRFPHAQLLVFFLFPINIRTATFIFGAWYVLNILSRGPNAGGDACHLAGLLFGLWWAMKGDAWWSMSGRYAWSRWISRFSGGGGGRSARAPRGFDAKMQQRRDDAETIDRILKKVYDGGVHSLSESEKRALQEATERQRQRDRDADRVDRL